MAQFSSISGDNFLLYLLFLPLVYFIFKKFKFSALSNNIPPLPPGPTPWPLIGNIPYLATKMPHIALNDLSKIHGPLMLLKLGTQNLVVASSPAAAKEILTTHDRLLSARCVPKSVPSNPEDRKKSSIVWADTCNDGWMFLRTLCRTELFSMKTLDAQSYLREKKISEMIEHVKDKKVVNIGDVVFVTMFNILSNVLLSCDLIGFNEKIEDGGMKGLIRKMAATATAPNISDFYPILNRFDIQGIRKNLFKMGKKVKDIFEPIIQARRKATVDQNDFLDVLLQNKFTNAHIQRLLMELMTAGTDTSTSTVEWAMAEFINNPKSMTKIIEELKREVGTDTVKEAHLVKLSYLQACIKETLRLHPPTPFLVPRRAPETCQVVNYTIPKNAQVFINVWAMGRDPLLWDDPLTFKPERFLNSSVDFKGNDFEFLPFGGGRRICPGLPMAGRLVPLVLASLLHSFDWSLPNENGFHELDMTEKRGISLQKKQPLLLIPRPRNG